MMKLAIRILALFVVVAGAAAAANTPKAAPAISGHLSATDNLPGPVCTPRLCPTQPDDPGTPQLSVK
jgi:hypothetical protein